ncbi:MAG: 50S ribosomal protein L15e [Candidatus Diapherotrites archaeon]|nr:50S ribosomal protein L15e [Candidatus Diapherotrites archaeon]
MSASRAIQETFQKEYAGEKGFKELYKQRLVLFRKEEKSVVRVEKPTNIARARKLGYKAKKGFVVVRVRVRKGSGMHTRPKSGRKPKRMGIRKLTRKKSIQSVAENRASKKFPNCEVLNSYWVGEDGKNKFYEIILVDTNAPEIKSDKDLKWMTSPKHRGRAERGLTSAGKKSRGLHKKGKGSEKHRPSLGAKGNKGK